MNNDLNDVFEQDDFILDPKNDVVFQKLFGKKENEDILLSFLNAVLGKQGNDRIVSVDFIDKKLNDEDILDEKIGILDVRVKTNEGTQINIEIQMINQYNMVKRTLFYWSKLYTSQIKKGGKYRELQKTITINILNFDYIDIEKFHTTYHLYEDEIKKMLTDILEVHFIEIPKFIKEQPNERDALHRWLMFLIKPNKAVLEVIEMADPAIRKAHNVLEILSRDPETIRLAELRAKAIMDEMDNIEGAREEGKREGREEGKREGKKEIAFNLLSLGFDILTVSKGTGLSEEEVKKIKEEISK
ncbi:MAG: Rpn family recombination-promoting nuclease/putative transposase [Bacillota bacterium]|nr:Rpn family recombination-promoting nuclease/putative transposase [Bacillota bacterium]